MLWKHDDSWGVSYLHLNQSIQGRKGSIQKWVTIEHYRLLHFYQMILVYLLLRFVIFDIATIVMSRSNNHCANLTNDPCIITYSGYNLKSDQDQDRLYILDILNAAFVVVALSVFIIFRKMLNAQKNLFVPFPFFKDRNYTILLEKLPPFFYQDKTPKEHADYHY